MAAVRLARLDLAPDELDRILAQVAEILVHIEELDSVPLGDAPALGGIAEADAPLRPDVRDPDVLAAPPSASAPAWAEGFFTLPRLAAMDGTREADA
jgi:Asp-tRNA(Asn)/Glu-tRNA(Gln) amidotransferase C subunit